MFSCIVSRPPTVIHNPVNDDETECQTYKFGGIIVDQSGNFVAINGCIHRTRKYDNPGNSGYQNPPIILHESNNLFPHVIDCT